MSEFVKHKPVMGDRGTFIPSPVRGVTMEQIPFRITTDRGTEKVTNAVLLTTNSDVGFALARDPRTARYGFATETVGGRLIDQRGTQAMDGYKGEPAGKDPDELLRRVGRGRDVVGYAPQHYGWIQGQFIIDDGRLVLSKQDVGKFTEYDVPLLGLQAGSNRWELRRVSLEEGTLTEPRLTANTMLGFNGPALVENGYVGDIVDIGTNSRVVGDPRNLLRLASYEVDGRFHELIRRVQPQTPEEMRAILEGKGAVIVTERLTYGEAKELSGIIKEDTLARRHLHLEPGYSRDDNEPVTAHLRIQGELPYNSIPMTVSGVNGNGNLAALIIPGRGERGGVEIPQASFMAEQLGMKDAIFGAAGNDVRLQGVNNREREIYVRPGTPDGEPRRHPLELAIFDIAA